MAIDYEKEALMDASRFVMLADFVPGAAGLLLAAEVVNDLTREERSRGD